MYFFVVVIDNIDWIIDFFVIIDWKNILCVCVWMIDVLERMVLWIFKIFNICDLLIDFV